MKLVSALLTLTLLAPYPAVSRQHAANRPPAAASRPAPRQEGPARPAPAAPGYKRAPGAHQVETSLFEWTDTARGRTVPVKIYSPQGAGPFPVIVFSHGLGGSRDGYEYLGRHWASHGYVVVHVQHPGSDSSVWQGTLHPLKSMRAASSDPANSIARPLDVRFTIDRLEALNREASPYKGRLDLEDLGVAGHSFGAYTALAVAGQMFVRGNREMSLADPRVKAVLAMSAPAPARKWQADKSYSRIKVPVLHMTGTRDDSPIGDTRASERRIPFDRISAVDQYLLVLNGGDHMVFSGARRPTASSDKDPVFLDLILMSSTAFWDVYLRGDTAARAWLANGGFEKALGAEGKLEKKLK
ncbi:MAG TPA: alpha/beta fold hydrolase [Thermoanaerobaculia bacterium]|nr:alpha/beta fold hydrolase [Thermoanaerobaculia bacterium]